VSEETAIILEFVWCHGHRIDLNAMRQRLGMVGGEVASVSRMLMRWSFFSIVRADSSMRRLVSCMLPMLFSSPRSKSWNSSNSS